MLTTRAARRRGISYAVLIAVSLALLVLNNTPPVAELRRLVGSAATPLQGALAGATRSALSVFGAIAEIDRLRGENRVLGERSRALEIEVRSLEEIRIQNEQLSLLLGVRSSLSYRTVAAGVVGRSVTQYERVLSLDRGTNAGISVGDVVLGGGAALVGQVVEVGVDYSRVLLISDTRSTVVGLDETSRAAGEVQGQLGGALVMAKIPSTDRVAVNDTVVTAGIDLGRGVRSPFPKGLVIGRIVDVRRDPTAVVQTAFVEPAAPLDKLEYAVVITDYEGGIPLRPESSSPASSSPDRSARPGSSSSQPSGPSRPPAP